MGIGVILSTLLGIGSQWLENKQRISAIKVENELALEKAKVDAEIARLKSAQDHEQVWEQTVASQMHTSWKDEWWTLIASVPLILAFFGEDGRRAVTEGFKAISGMPDWYIAIVAASVAASFGLRALANLKR